MPTYGYECLSCDNQFETIQSIKDDALSTCESCGGTLRKRIYPVGISFKGSGFYVNDYAPKAGGASGGAAETTKPETGGEGKTEPAAESGKTEPKAETKTEKTETKSESVKSDAKPEAKAPASSPVS